MQEIYVYGAGDEGIHLLRRINEYYSDEINIVAFFDESKSGNIDGIPILDIKDSSYAKLDNLPTVIAIGQRKEAVHIYGKLQEKGFKEVYYGLRYDNPRYENNYLLTNECLLLNEKSKNIIPHIEVHAFDGCNLNCSGCAHFSPLYDRKKPNTNARLNDFDFLRKISDKILSVFILGGEPLLNQDIISYITKIRTLYPLTDLQIVTNGLLLPQMSQSFYDAVRTSKTCITVSEYKPTFAMRSKIIGKLQSERVHYAFRPYDTKQKFTIPLKGDESNEFKHACISDGCVSIKEGRIARCPMVLYVDKLNETFSLRFPTDGIYNIIDFKNAAELNRCMEIPIPLCNYCIDKEIDWHICGVPQQKDFVIN